MIRPAPMPVAGRLPPHNHEAEQQLLGAILKDNRVYERVAAFLAPEHFADDRHGRVFEVCGKLIERGHAASVVTLKGWFERDLSLAELGGAPYLVSLLTNVLSPAFAMDHARLVHDLAQRRQLLAQLEAATERLHADVDDPASDQAVDLVSGIETITRAAASGVLTVRQVREKIANEMKAPVVCDSTGLHCLDAMLAGGLHAGRCYGLMGRFKSGKTLLGGQISHNLNRQDIRHLYIAAEMGSTQIEQRNLAAEIGCNASAFYSPAHRDNTGFVARIGQAAISAQNATLYLDAHNLRFDRLKREATNAVLAHKVRGIVLDYLQLLRGWDSRRQTHVEFLEDVCQWLAALCGQRNIWCLVLGQFNDKGGVRHGEAALMAFDHVFEIRRDQDGIGTGAWLETVAGASRHTAGEGAGSEACPALRLDKEIGPRWVETGT